MGHWNTRLSHFHIVTQDTGIPDGDTGVYILLGLLILFPTPSEALILFPLQKLTVSEGKGMESKGRGRVNGNMMKY